MHHNFGGTGPSRESQSEHRNMSCHPFAAAFHTKPHDNEFLILYLVKFNNHSIYVGKLIALGT